MAKSKQTYSEILEELEKILLELENETNIDMEMIAGKVKQASALLELCKKQLYDIDIDLEKMLASLD